MDIPIDISSKQLAVFDLDGTLAPSKSPMSPEIAELIARLMKRMRVAVISGGGYPQFETQFLRSFSSKVEGFSNLYLLPTSGTRMYSWKGSWSEMYSEKLSEQEKNRIIEALDISLAECGYAVPTKAYGQLIEDRGSQITFSGLGQNAPLELKEKWDPDRQRRLKIAESLKKRLAGFDIRIGGTTSIDITRRGINKAYGIHKLEHHLKIPISDMVFVGDALFYGGNDYPAKSTGVDCVQVSGPEQTKNIIAGWLE